MILVHLWYKVQVNDECSISDKVSMYKVQVNDECSISDKVSIVTHNETNHKIHYTLHSTSTHRFS